MPFVAASRGTPRAVGLLLALSLFAARAQATNALNSSEQPPASPLAQPTDATNDLVVVPVVGGSTDIGVGGGYFAGLTRNKKGFDPFVWSVESAGFISFAERDGSLQLPFLDVYAKLTVPRLLGGPVQLDIRPSYTDEKALYYFGMGDASTVDPMRPSRSYQYGRIHPTLLADARIKLVDHLALITGARITGTWLDIPANTQLADDLAHGSPEVRALIGPTGPQAVALGIAGLQFDNRDNEVTPHRGTYDEAKLQVSPGGSPTFPFRYSQMIVNARVYVPLTESRLTLAGRTVADVIVGDAPFYELSRFEDSYAVGGANGVRGVPAQRYYGKIRLFGNAELRARLFDFHLLSKPMTMGSAVFLDVGRVWADTSSHPELDGAGLGIKYGVGGGLRLMSGTAFVIRADVAWSPDARPVGAYVAAGEMF